MDEDVKRRVYLQTCAGKEQYESRGVAEQVRRRRASKGAKLNVYKCDGCGKYHIGGNKWLTNLTS